MTRSSFSFGQTQEKEKEERRRELMTGLDERIRRRREGQGGREKGGGSAYVFYDSY